MERAMTNGMRLRASVRRGARTWCLAIGWLVAVGAATAADLPPTLMGSWSKQAGAVTANPRLVTLEADATAIDGEMPARQPASDPCEPLVRQFDLRLVGCAEPRMARHQFARQEPNDAQPAPAGRGGYLYPGVRSVPGVGKNHMARQPEDMVVRILQQIKATLADHGSMHEEHRQAFIRIERRLDEALDSSITAIGLASHANVRHNTVREEIEELKRRVERLEEKQQS
jgi:polyhydroxyalkanoate synthesis regulator phasin